MQPQAIKVADLRRIKVGTKLRQVHNLRGPCDHERVDHVTSGAIFFTGPDIKGTSYLPFPKAADLHGDQSGFTVMFGTQVGAKYVAVDWENNPLFGEKP